LDIALFYMELDTNIGSYLVSDDFYIGHSKTGRIKKKVKLWNPYDIFIRNIKYDFSTLIIIINQILILEWFGKDHVTLKTGVMMINSALITGILHFTIYSH